MHVRQLGIAHMRGRRAAGIWDMPELMCKTLAGKYRDNLTAPMVQCRREARSTETSSPTKARRVPARRLVSSIHVGIAGLLDLVLGFG
eukprot:6749071-Pyramimonas_sp.AAC.2